ncbi:MAG: hypothetical protein JWM55_1472, partial [Acidimicrobiaceae bacterium]|nr:hypothetical protein [Acidimicrobiaceae bacterium]
SKGTTLTNLAPVRHEKTNQTSLRNTQADSTSSEGSSTRQTIVDWLDKEGNQAVVTDGTATVYVGVVRPNTGSAYVRTYADGIWKDNLLALPRY